MPSQPPKPKHSSSLAPTRRDMCALFCGREACVIALDALPFLDFLHQLGDPGSPSWSLTSGGGFGRGGGQQLESAVTQAPSPFQQQQQQSGGGGGSAGNVGAIIGGVVAGTGGARWGCTALQQPLRSLLSNLNGAVLCW